MSAVASSRQLVLFHILQHMAKFITLKGLGHALLGNSLCLILLIIGSEHQIGRARVSHLQNHGNITTVNDFPAV